MHINKFATREPEFARQKKVRFLCRLGQDFTGFEVAAMRDDAKPGLKHLSGWEKMAVVSDAAWIRVAIEAFGLALPGRVRVFHNSELADAKRSVGTLHAGSPCAIYPADPRGSSHYFLIAGRESFIVAAIYYPEEEEEEMDKEAAAKAGVEARRDSNGPDRTRRRLVQAAGGALAASSLPGLAYAARSRTLKVGFISPRTGPLAGFGECDPYVIHLARKALAKGLRVDGHRYHVEILDRDTQSDPARASQLAKSLINDAHVDLMLTTSTPEVVNPVSDACEAAGVPCLSTIVPWESWYFGRGAKPGQPSPFHWTYHFCFGGHDFFVAYNSQWNGPVKTNKRVGILYPNDADGNAVRAHLAPELAKAGFTIVDPGGYEDGTTDYTAQISKFKIEECEIFNTFPIPPDFATFWRQAAQQGYTRMVKIAQIAKTGLFPSQVEALGSLGPKLATACYWHPTWPYKSPLTGHSSQALGDGYEKTTGRQWTQQVGASMALLDAGFATLQRSGNPKNKSDVAKAMSVLDVVTPVGPINFKTGPVPNVSATPIIGSQWLKAEPGSKFKLRLPLTEHADDPHVPIGAQLVPYNS